MKTLEELLYCIEDDLELMGPQRIVYLMEADGDVVDYDYLPSSDYIEPIRLIELQTELKKKRALLRIDTPEEKEKKKLVVLFPGIGYTCDKPLLYYSAKLAGKYSYEIKKISYGPFTYKKGDADSESQALHTLLNDVKEQLSCVDLKQYDDILFISKSLGTVVSSAYARQNNIHCKNILYTPLSDTYEYVSDNSIAFHGTNDSWAVTDEIIKLSEKCQIPLYLYESANHSLETGDMKTDLKNLVKILEQAEEFMI